MKDSRAREGVAKPRTRRQRGSISVDEIVAGALRLAADCGLEALSMPKLAKSLDIGVTSIYWYFESKDALIEAMAEQAARTLQSRLAPLPSGSWQDHSYAMFTRLYTILWQDDLLCDLLYMRGSRLSENALLHLWPELEAGLKLMVEAGFDHADALENHVLLSLHMRGTIILARQMRLAGTSASAPRAIPPTLPHLIEATRFGQIRGASNDAYFRHVRKIIRGMALGLGA